MVATIAWLVLGLLLCLSEILTPKVLVELPMGVSALVMALLSQLIPQVNLQIFLWLLFSLGFVVLLRHFAPRRQAYTIQDAPEAQTLTAIAPGQVGRVIYEGNSWQARCETGVQRYQLCVAIFGSGSLSRDDSGEGIGHSTPTMFYPG